MGGGLKSHSLANRKSLNIQTGHHSLNKSQNRCQGPKMIPPGSLAGRGYIVFMTGEAVASEAARDHHELDPNDIYWVMKPVKRSSA